MTALERIRAWEAVQSAGRDIVADAGLPREVREGGALSQYAWKAGELHEIVEPDGSRFNYGYGEDGRLLWVDKNARRWADYRYDAAGRLIAVTDRKSTRLNSSHANISYAVFCLKKKNKKITCT